MLRTLSFKIIPELCREPGWEITINENTETIHVSKPNEIPNDSPFKKLIKTACMETKEINERRANETPRPTYSLTVEKSYEIFAALIEMLPRVIQTFMEAGKVNEFVQFN